MFLVHLVAPQIGMFSFGEEPLNAGDMASVQCAVMKGDFPLEIAFMFEGNPIESYSDIVVSENGKRIKQLLIDSVNAKHAGEYTCVASNIAGSTSRSAMLAVNGIFFFFLTKFIECRILDFFFLFVFPYFVLKIV